MTLTQFYKQSKNFEYCIKKMLNAENLEDKCRFYSMAHMVINTYKELGIITVLEDYDLFMSLSKLFEKI